MLAKLMKYEVKATARWFLPLYIAILFSAVLNRLLFINPLVNNTFMINESFGSVLKGILSSLSMFLYVTLFVGIFVATLIVVIQRFYKSLLGDEGYLMFTLPVMTWQHILNKLIISMLWYSLSSIVALGSILILIPKEDFSQLPYLFNQIIEFLGVPGLILIISFVVLSLIASVLEIYSAIALGHLFNKHKLLLSFCIYLGIRTVSQFVLLLITFLSIMIAHPLINDIDVNIALQFKYLLSVITFVLAIFTAGHFTLTSFLIKRKLNLE